MQTRSVQPKVLFGVIPYQSIEAMIFGLSAPSEQILPLVFGLWQKGSDSILCEHQQGESWPYLGKPSLRWMSRWMEIVIQPPEHLVEQLLCQVVRSSSWSAIILQTCPHNAWHGYA